MFDLKVVRLADICLLFKKLFEENHAIFFLFLNNKGEFCYVTNNYLKCKLS